MAAVRELGDVVIKPIFGSMGHGIVRVSDPDVAFRVVKTLETTRAVFYVQRAIDHGGRDYRLFVLGGRVLAAIERRAAAGDWRSNVARGGRGHRRSRRRPSGEQLAVRAAAAIEADYAGVDLLQGSDGTRLRARGQRHSRVGGAAARDRRGRGRRHRGARGGARAHRREGGLRPA